jgi:hypothetical protein
MPHARRKAYGYRPVQPHEPSDVSMDRQDTYRPNLRLAISPAREHVEGYLKQVTQNYIWHMRFCILEIPCIDGDSLRQSRLSSLLTFQVTTFHFCHAPHHKLLLAHEWNTELKAPTQNSRNQIL